MNGRPSITRPEAPITNEPSWADDEPVAEPIPVRRPGLDAVVSILTLSHASWMVWFWVGGSVLATGIVAFWVFRGELDESVWRNVAGFQLWIAFAAGVTTVPVYLAMFVRHGVPRRTLAHASLLALPIVSIVAGLWVAAGFALERVVYERNDWPQELGDGRVVDGFADVFALGGIATVAYLAFSVSGWLVGWAWRHAGWPWFVLWLVPAAIPLLVAAWTLEHPVPRAVLPVTVDWEWGVAVPITLLVTIVGAGIAHRLTRSVAVRA